MVLKTLAVVVAVILLVGAIVVVYSESGHSVGTVNARTGPTVAVVDSFVVELLAGTTVTSHFIYYNSTAANGTGPLRNITGMVKGIAVYYNETHVNGTRGNGTVLAVSIEFSSAEAASSFYNRDYPNSTKSLPAGATVSNASLDGFDYFIEKSPSTIFLGNVSVSVGIDGAYVFGVMDMDIPLNFSSLVASQITMMVSLPPSVSA